MLIAFCCAISEITSTEMVEHSFLAIVPMLRATRFFLIFIVMPLLAVEYMLCANIKFIVKAVE